MIHILFSIVDTVSFHLVMELHNIIMPVYLFIFLI